MNLLLLIGSTTAFALLIVHSWKTRGRAVTLAFFGFGILYGLLRENAIWLLMQVLTAGAADVKPYMPQGGILPEIGHANLQVSVGWVFSMYLAWTISELILRRVKGGEKTGTVPNIGTVPIFAPFSSRVFMIAGLSALFMQAICYCMETTAVAVGWWYWHLPTRSVLFGNVSPLGMEGWFTVVPDFLLPFLVIACSEARSRWKWLWALAFPLHIGGHMIFRFWPHALVVYHVLELLVVAPMTFSTLRMAKGEINPATPRFARALPAVALAIFFGVVTFANAVGIGGPGLFMTEIPMLMLCLLAWSRLPAWGVLAASAAAVAGWLWIGPRVLWALAPVTAYGFLRLLDRLRGPLWLRVVPPAAVAALAALSMWLDARDVDRMYRYVKTWREADVLALDGKSREAEEAYARADSLRPRDVLNFQNALSGMTEIPDPPEDLPESEKPRWREHALLVYRNRIPRIIREREELVRRDPECYLSRQYLVLYYLIEGRLTDAAQQYREIHNLHPADVNITAMYGYLLLRLGELEEARRVCEEAGLARRPPPEALVNLGVIRLHDGRDDEARRLWERALERDGANAVARLNLERLGAPTPDRRIDPRYLARDRETPGTAPRLYNLAILRFREGASGVRLLSEAVQMDPNFLRGHLKLADVFLRDEGPLLDVERGVWHARRAVALARDSHDDATLPRALLLLGKGLLMDGKREEARRALDEGRAIAPPELRGEFDRLLK